MYTVSVSKSLAYRACEDTPSARMFCAFSPSEDEIPSFQQIL
jgi:hypothetical protein